ncbi:hypothetical protein [Pantoea endophytica]
MEYFNMWRPHTHLGGLSPIEYEVTAQWGVIFY